MLPPPSYRVAAPTTHGCRYDADEDGCLRLSEFAALVSDLREKRRAQAAGDAEGAGAAITPAAPPTPPLPPYAPSMWSANRKTLLLQSKQRAARRGGGSGGAGGGGGSGGGGGRGHVGGDGDAMHAAVMGVMRQRRTFRALRDAPVISCSAQPYTNPDPQPNPKPNPTPNPNPNAIP